MAELVLASASPRRQQLLHQIGLKFRVHISDVDESAFHGQFTDPRELAGRLAQVKAEAVAAEEPDTVVLAADTVVVVDGDVLGKPADSTEAVAMLTRLQGREHLVMTGVAVVHRAAGRRESFVEETRVSMRSLRQEEIAAYIALGEPMDKAGAYAIQGLGATIVTRLEGCFFNVVGLPLARTAAILGTFGIEVLRGRER